MRHFLARQCTIIGIKWPMIFVLNASITPILVIFMVSSETSGLRVTQTTRKKMENGNLRIHHIKVFYRTMIFWFFTAAMIESFNLWRWNYGPYKEPVNHAGHSGEFKLFL